MKAKLNEEIQLQSLMRQVENTGNLWKEMSSAHEQDKVRTTIYLSRATHKKAKKYCVDHDTTVTALIERLLEDALKEGQE